MTFLPKFLRRKPVAKPLSGASVWSRDEIYVRDFKQANPDIAVDILPYTLGEGFVDVFLEQDYDDKGFGFDTGQIRFGIGKQEADMEEPVVGFFAGTSVPIPIAEAKRLHAALGNLIEQVEGQ